MRQMRRIALGTAQQKTPASSITIAGVNAPAGAVIEVGLIFTGSTSLVGITAGGQAMTLSEVVIVSPDFSFVVYRKDNSGAISGGTIVATFSSPAVAAMIGVGFLRAAAAPADDTAITSASGAAVASSPVQTSQPVDMLCGFIACAGPAGDLAPNWLSGFTAGQFTGTTGGAAASNCSIAEAYREVAEIGIYGFEAGLSAARDWGAYLAALKAGEGVSIEQLNTIGGRDSDRVTGR